MNLFTTAITFLVIWWLILFMVLPFGASPPEDVKQGHAASAPAKPRMLIKLLITTLLAIGATFAVQWFLQSGLIELRPSSSG
jgi:predicted secreted protein